MSNETNADIPTASGKLGILLEGTHARACAGKAPRETGDKLHGRAIHLFERAQALIR